jgi:hypothetical protein
MFNHFRKTGVAVHRKDAQTPAVLAEFELRRHNEAAHRVAYRAGGTLAQIVSSFARRHPFGELAATRWLHHIGLTGQTFKGRQP